MHTHSQAAFDQLGVYDFVIKATRARPGNRAGLFAARTGSGRAARRFVTSEAHLSHAVERLTFRRDVWQGFGMKAALLPDRGVVKVVGDDASRLLNGLVTADVEKITPARPAFAAPRQMIWPSRIAPT